MRQTIQFTFLCFLVVSAAFAGRPVPNYDSLESRIVPVYDDAGEKAIGVYAIAGASYQALPARTALNHRVNYYIENGQHLPGVAPLQMLTRSDTRGGLDELRPANRALLLLLRLSDVEGDARYWLNEECLDSAPDTIVENSLIEWLMYYMGDALDQFRAILNDEQPFSHLIDDGFYTEESHFTHEEYLRMHDFFQRYVDFVEQVLNPWRDAWEGENRNIHLQGDFWRRRVGDVLNFRTYAQGHAQYAQAHLRHAGGLERLGPFGEADDRIDAIDRGPLDALIAMVLMEGMLNGMHGFWAELRGVLNEQDYTDMLRYRTAEQLGDETPEDAVYRRLATLNGLLLVQNLVPIEGNIQDQGAYNRNITQLYREIRNHVLLLYRYANTDTRREGDWEAFMEAGRTVDALIDRHFAFDDPLDFDDEDDEADGRDEEVHPGVGGGGYSDEEEDSMELSADDDEGNRDDGGVVGFRVNGGTYFLTNEAVRTALATALTCLHGLHHPHSGGWS